MTNAFTVTGSAGEYDIPANQAFNIGDTVYYRYRTIDSTVAKSPSGHLVHSYYQAILSPIIMMELQL